MAPVVAAVAWASWRGTRADGGTRSASAHSLTAARHASAGSGVWPAASLVSACTSSRQRAAQSWRKRARAGESGLDLSVMSHPVSFAGAA